ncbi:uncharacterized protein QYS62_006688 [Fusarium acuminatum]|uniref:Uncharacterized protein n=1 Tax=Fusarium acuminatum TaxID=5515 RepID=A0ABZ2X0K1_9HYPO
MDGHNARLFNHDDDSSLNPEITTIANRYPESFLNHLRAAWEKDGAKAAQIPSVLTSLKATLVLCEDGVKRPLSTTYLPTRRLCAVVGKYIRRDDKFPFLQFQKFWSLEENIDAWAFLSFHLGVGNDEDLDLYLDILKTIRTERSLWHWSQKFPKRILSLYLHIETAYAGNDGNRKKIRSAFVVSPNIAMRCGNELRWYKQAECIWCTDLKSPVPGYVNLSGGYQGLEEFFVGFLGVKKLSTSYENLLHCEATSVSIDTVKEMLLTLSAVIAEKGRTLDPAPLLSKKILPVRGRNGKVRFCTADADFYIIDRPYLDVFRNTAPVLDFSVSDLARLIPFLEWATLECHYLSWNVKESGFLQGSYPTPLDGRITTEKARGLLRTKSLEQRQLLLRQLEGSRFIETAGIFRDVKLMLADGSEVVHQLEGQLHIVGENLGLRIYVPRDKTSQELSAVLLPRYLVQWLMTDTENDRMPVIDEATVSLVKSISNVRDELIQRVLTEEGIIPLEGLVHAFALTKYALSASPGDL